MKMILMKVRRFISTFEDIDYTKDQLLNHQNVKGVIIDRRNDFLYHTNSSVVVNNVRQGYFITDDFRDVVFRGSLTQKEVILISLGLLCDRCGADLSMENNLTNYGGLCNKCKKELYDNYDNDFSLKPRAVNLLESGDRDGDRLSLKDVLSKNIDL